MSVGCFENVNEVLSTIVMFSKYYNLLKSMERAAQKQEQAKRQRLQRVFREGIKNKHLN